MLDIVLSHLFLEGTLPRAFPFICTGYCLILLRGALLVPPPRLHWVDSSAFCIWELLPSCFMPSSSQARPKTRSCLHICMYKTVFVFSSYFINSLGECKIHWLKIIFLLHCEGTAPLSSSVDTIIGRFDAILILIHL